MNLREVTIGRSPNCDIYLDQRCKYASNMHGTIYYDGNQLMFKDTSSNGTMINNISVRKRAVPIRRGDTIMIAGKYPINWNQIDSFFPSPKGSAPLPHYYGNHPVGTIADVSLNISKQASVAEPLNLSKWSWGAFTLSWIWGFFNGCWWMFLVNLGFFLLNMFAWVVPLVGVFVTIANLSVSILFGMKGTEWAWNNRKWDSISAFNQTQDIWNKVGLALFVFSWIVILLFFILSFATISHYFSA